MTTPRLGTGIAVFWVGLLQLLFGPVGIVCLLSTIIYLLLSR